MTQRTVLVTGAAGVLGSAVTARFRSAGDRVVAFDHHARDADDGLVHISADLADRQKTGTAVTHAMQVAGPIAVLVHAAGGFDMGPPVHETEPALLEAMLDRNTRSLMNIVHAVVPGMITAGSGKIVTIGAMAALRANANMAAYAISKSAVIRLTEAMSTELRGHGINVNCVLPSIIDTPTNRSAMPKADPAKWVAPEDLAEVIFFLASKQARAIHGTAIPVTGLS